MVERYVNSEHRKKNCEAPRNPQHKEQHYDHDEFMFISFALAFAMTRITCGDFDSRLWSLPFFWVSFCLWVTTAALKFAAESLASRKRSEEELAWTQRYFFFQGTKKNNGNFRFALCKVKHDLVSSSYSISYFFIMIRAKGEKCFSGLVIINLMPLVYISLCIASISLFFQPLTRSLSLLHSPHPLTALELHNEKLRLWKMRNFLPCEPFTTPNIIHHRIERVWSVLRKLWKFPVLIIFIRTLFIVCEFWNLIKVLQRTTKRRTEWANYERGGWLRSGECCE